MVIFKLLLALVSGYVLGSVNTSIIVGKMFGEDVRGKGSGNAGLNNTLRLLGLKAALIVLFGDVLKGVLACLLGYVLTASEFGSEGLMDYANPNLGLMLAGTSCIFGHIFPVFFQFKGGKGVLTAATVIFMMDWRLGAISICLFIIVVLITKYISVGSMVSAAGLPIISLILEKPSYSMVYSIAIALLIIVMHRKNIGRLINGAETKLKVGK
ncbi:MAG: glycerol-3-phosphate 1-O-acyltransferase PlsY [Oscillospiraceae bacterium]|nr:glycerol-3-phosphate 1-O-acyltransferase PlsY [Oscillospiraceae bacterium]